MEPLPTDPLERALFYAIRQNALLTDADRQTVMTMALLMDGSPATPHRSSAIAYAATALNTYRRGTRHEAAVEFAASLPVRQTVPAGDGGGRFYWRLAWPCEPGNSSNDGFMYIQVTDNPKLKGTLSMARGKARDMFIEGRQHPGMEIVPPDYDPSDVDDWTVNRAPNQPDGLTVRQRHKKH